MTDVKDEVKKLFKYYKSKNPPPNYKSVIDIKDNNDSNVEPFQLNQGLQMCLNGLKDMSMWKAYHHKSYPGFVLIENPFHPKYQRYWAYRCLHDYPVKPSKTNLDIHVDLSKEDNIWQLSNNKGEEKTLIQRLRWATLGFHHDWNTKKYNEEDHTPFPDDLAMLSKYIASTIDWPEYNAEAAIINMYHLDSTLAGHTDHSEFDHEAPLISVSFGQTAIFLVGGNTRAETPLAVYLRSGDIAVMMGPRRLAYHAVPRVLSSDRNYVRQCFYDNDMACDKSESNKHCSSSGLDYSSEHERKTDIDYSNQSNPSNVSKEDTKTAHLNAGNDIVEDVKTDTSDDQDSGSCSQCGASDNGDITSRVNQQIQETMEYLTDDVWEPFSLYLDKSRINMNIRQVYKLDQRPISSDVKRSESVETKKMKLS